MPYPQLIPEFSDLQEIRMGSPYNCVSLKLHGNWSPDLPQTGWQDLFAESPNGRILTLVAWDIDENGDPGFILWSLDNKTKRVSKSERIAGCLHAISWSTAGVSLEIHRHIAQAELCSLSNE